MSASKDGYYYIRDYQPGDETAIRALFNTVFGQPLTVDYWRWKYTGTGLTSPMARLAFAGDGQLIGHAGAIALRGWRRGQSLPFFQICDVMVHPAARGHLGGRNLFTRLTQELLSRLADRWPTAFAYGFPGRRPFRLGEYAKVYGAVTQACNLRRPVSNPWLPLPGTRALAWEDARLDALWIKLAHMLPLALIRDRAYVQWRYAHHPQYRYQLVGLHLGGWLFGWAVVQPGEIRLRVVDLLVGRRWLSIALRALDRLAAAMSVAEVEIWLPPGWREGIRGEIELTEIMVTNMVWRLPLPTATVSEELYYTMGDLDIF